MDKMTLKVNLENDSNNKIKKNPRNKMLKMREVPLRRDALHGAAHERVDLQHRVEVLNRQAAAITQQSDLYQIGSKLAKSTYSDTNESL